MEDGRRGVAWGRSRRDQVARSGREDRRARGWRGPRGPRRGWGTGRIRSAAAGDHAALMPARRIEIACSEAQDGWVARVTVTAPTRTSHTVRVSRAELERYGGGDVG